MRRLFDALPFTWLLLGLPAGWIAARYLSGAVTYGQALHETGDWAAWLLVAAMAVTPLRLLAPRAGWSQWLMRRRRALGVATFGYALFHTLVYLVRKAQPALIIQEGARPDLLAGWIALAVLLALALTSNDVSVRWLGRRWKALHRLVYPAAALTFLHWLLTAFDRTNAVVTAAVLIAVEAVRLGLVLRNRRVRSSGRSPGRN